MAKHGGRMPAKEHGRPATAPSGPGKQSRRHDLESRVPPLHDSDLQQGDVQTFEEGKRVTKKQTQAPAQEQRQTSTSPPGGASGAGVSIPDPIQFLGGQQGQEFDVEGGDAELDNSRALTWIPILRELASGPGSSGVLASALINQARHLRRTRRAPARIIDLQATDDAIEAMLNEGV